MNRQEVVQRVRDHLLSASKRAVSEHGTCQFRTPEGLKCAVGCLFPDDYDVSGFNSAGLSNSINETRSRLVAALDDIGVPRESHGFLMEAQDLHDCEYNWNDDGLYDKAVERLHELCRLELCRQELNAC